VTDNRPESIMAIVPGVSRETCDMLVMFEQALIKWNRSINLVATSTEAEIWSRHILDSAQLAALAPAARRWLDIGSGGGFPGLVLAILLRDRPGGHIDLVESNRKKAGFLQAMVGQFRLHARIHAVRIEAMSVEPIDVVTARALAPMPLLLELSERWLSGGARALFHKGRDYVHEVSESSQRWTFDLLEHRSAIDPGGVILEISNLHRNQG